MNIVWMGVGLRKQTKPVRINVFARVGVGRVVLARIGETDKPEGGGRHRMDSRWYIARGAGVSGSHRNGPGFV